MKVLYPTIGLERLCRLFGKTRQAYYDHSSRQSGRQMHEALIVEMIKSIRCSLPKIGGLKTLHMLKSDFSAHRMSIGRDSFFALLKKYGLIVRRKKRYAVTTDSNHHYKK